MSCEKGFALFKCVTVGSKLCVWAVTATMCDVIAYVWDIAAAVWDATSQPRCHRSVAREKRKTENAFAVRSYPGNPENLFNNLCGLEGVNHPQRGFTSNMQNRYYLCKIFID